MIVGIRTTFSTTASASGLKHVHCEHCGEDYVYLINRCGVGHGTSRLPVGDEIARERASELAAINAQHLVEYDVDPVACPHCGMFQSDMVCKLRNRHQRWLWISGAAFALLGVLNFAMKLMQGSAVLANPVETMKVLVLPAFGVLLAASWIVARMIYNPNALPADRKAAISTAPALRYEDYADKLAEHAKHGVSEIAPEEFFRDARPAA